MGDWWKTTWFRGAALGLAAVLLLIYELTLFRIIPVFPADASAWMFFAFLVGALGTAAAVAAVVIALVDRVRRERPELVVQRADFSVADGRFVVQDALVNVGGGPAIQIVVSVRVPYAIFRFTDYPRAGWPQMPTLPEPLEWTFDAAAIAANHGIGEPVVNRELLRTLALGAMQAYEEYVVLREDERGIDRPRQLQEPFEVYVEIDSISVSTSYTDRGRRRKYPEDGSVQSASMGMLMTVDPTVLREPTGRELFSRVAGFIHPAWSRGLMFVVGPLGGGSSGT